jgi:hypothetical protein
VFQIVVSLEQGIAGEEFYQNTADGPNVAWIGPAHTFEQEVLVSDFV